MSEQRNYEHEFVTSIRELVEVLKQTERDLPEGLPQAEARLLVNLENSLASYDANKARERKPTGIR